MKNSIFHFLLLFVVLVISQVTIFNNVGIGGYANPSVYLLFILLLPLDIKGWVLLLYAFILGLVIDMFSNTPGLHTASTLMLAFMRPWVVELISGRSDFDPGTIPLFSVRGQRWMFTYIFLLILVHHVLLFFLEVFHFQAFFLTLSKALISTAATALLIIIGMFLLDKSAKTKR